MRVFKKSTKLLLIFGNGMNHLVASGHSRPDFKEKVLPPGAEIRGGEDRTRFQQFSAMKERCLADGIQHAIEGVGNLREVLDRVVDDTVRARGILRDPDAGVATTAVTSAP